MAATIATPTITSSSVRMLNLTSDAGATVFDGTFDIELITNEKNLGRISDAGFVPP
jgi:hypothetical protein